MPPSNLWLAGSSALEGSVCRLASSTSVFVSGIGSVGWSKDRSAKGILGNWGKLTIRGGDLVHFQLKQAGH